MRNRKTPEINAGSMADIAFLLLIFWLVATTLTPEYGLESVLKGEGEEPKIAVVTQSRDIIRVHVTDDGVYEVEVNGTRDMTKEELYEYAGRVRARSGFKTRVILTSDYYAPYEVYMGVLEIVESLNINIIENEIQEELEEGDGIVDDEVEVWFTDTSSSLPYVKVQVDSESYRKIKIVFFDKDGKYVTAKTIYLTFGTGEGFVSRSDYLKISTYKYILS